MATLASRPSASARIRAIAKVVVPLVLLALLVRGVMFFLVDMRPADRVHLAGSTWTIVEVEGQPVPHELLLSFDADVGSGEISSACGRLTFDYDLDTDDIGIEFYNLTNLERDCGTEAALRAALLRVEAWQAPADNRIEFSVEGGPLLLTAVR